MIRLVYSNATEALLTTLAEDLDAVFPPGRDPLARIELVVPNRNVESMVRLGLAEARGVSGNLRFRRLDRFVADLARRWSHGNRLLDWTSLKRWPLRDLVRLPSRP